MCDKFATSPALVPRFLSTFHIAQSWKIREFKYVQMTSFDHNSPRKSPLQKITFLSPSKMMVLSLSWGPGDIAHQPGPRAIATSMALQPFWFASKKHHSVRNYKKLITNWKYFDLDFAPGCIFAKQPLDNSKTIPHKVQDYSALVIGVFSGGFRTFIIDLVKWSTALEPLHAAFSAEFVWDL